MFLSDVRYSQGFSGADMRLLCKEAAMRPVRRLMSRLEALDLGDNDTDAAPASSIEEREVQVSD